MTYDALKLRFPNASEQFLRSNSADLPPLNPIPPSILERRPRNGALAKSKVKRPNPTRFLVRVTSYRQRLLDEDNLCEKYHVDCCRYAGILKADSPDQAKIETRQVKVSSKAEERTEITISMLNPPPND